MKVLIYYNKNELKKTGGPAGYLYNLYQGLKEVDTKDIDIDFLDLPIDNKHANLKKKMPKFILKYISKVRRKGHFISKINSILSSNGGNNSVVFDDYDIIHFHSSSDFYSCRESLKKYKGKTIVMSHSPMVMFKELIAELSEKEKEKYKDALENVDLYAFNNADYILFPTKEAMECYYNSWDKFDDIYNKNKDKFIYLLTGICPCFSNTDKYNVRNNYKIPNDAFVISYVGRHNEVKGYDILKKIGDIVLNKYNNVYFLVAGEEAPLKGLNNERWIEVGWTNNPYSIIDASDVFVLPNRETYFDIVMLEILSLGKPVIASYTGGNKYFKKFNDSGIFLYNSIDEAIKIIDKYVSNKDELIKLGKENIRIYNDNFNEKVFASNYLLILKKILKK